MATLRVDRRQILKGIGIGALGGLLAALGPTTALADDEDEDEHDGEDHEDHNAQELVQRWCGAWNSHNVAQVLAVFTDDVFYEDVPFGLVNHGSAELAKFVQSFFTAVPDIHVQCVNTAVHGGHGFIEWVFGGTDVGLFKTGKPFSVRGASVIDVRGGRISRESDYYDAATIMREEGLLH
jgi:steroid delta-isomerase-like uncharacterized protein